MKDDGRYKGFDTGGMMRDCMLLFFCLSLNLPFPFDLLHDSITSIVGRCFAFRLFTWDFLIYVHAWPVSYNFFSIPHLCS